MSLEPSTSIARPPTARELLQDRLFRGVTRTFAWVTIVVVVFIVWQIASTAAPAIGKHGLKFLTGSEWNASKQEFGILPPIWGTVYSSVLGVAFGSLFGVAVAIFLTQNFLPPRWGVVLKNVIELLFSNPDS